MEAYFYFVSPQGDWGGCRHRTIGNDSVFVKGRETKMEGGGNTEGKCSLKRNSEWERKCDREINREKDCEK